MRSRDIIIYICPKYVLKEVSYKIMSLIFKVKSLGLGESDAFLQFNLSSMSI